MRAEASHAGTLRTVGRVDGEVAMPARARRRPVTYVDYGRPPPGRSLSSGAAALAVALLFLLAIRGGLL